MCGIGGLLLPKGHSPSQETLEILKKALHHRGPDDAGEALFESAALVHTRLSIIDVAGGHQPLTSPQGTHLVVNGEIYNYLELRKAYQDYPFTCQSDAETILPVYEKKGVATFTQDLRGMYSFCLYEPETHRALLCRDPFGIKPLYYVMLEEGGLAFASEASALLSAGLAKRCVNPKARSEAFQLGFTVGDKTVSGFIKRVLPGETLVVENGQITGRHKEAFSPPNPRPTPEKEALKNLEETLRESVRVHLRSDVPYGLFLSGGLDSATLLKLMSEESSQPVKTYTIGFSGAKVHDERDQAKSLATHFNSDHLELDFCEKDFWQLLPLVAKACDDLHFDQAMLPTYKLAAHAAKELKVVLSGEGGDELFAGYRRYQKVLRPWFLGPYHPRKRGFFDRLKKRGFPHLSGWRDAFTDLEERFGGEGATSTPPLSKLRTHLFLDQKTWLPNDLLLKLDRCLMAHGLEGRTPFLDPVVRAFTASLPDSFLVKKPYGKWILRQWLSQTLPQSQPFSKKKGFRVPVGEWISEKGPRLASLVARQEGIEEILSYDQVKALFLGKDDRTLFAAWELLFYAIWHQIHVLGRSPVPDTLAMLAKV